MRWFRMYSDLIHKRKIQRLPAQVFKDWVNILCVANEAHPRGTIKDIADVSYQLRIRPKKASDMVTRLHAYGLLDSTPDGYKVHDWDEYQPSSDDAAARMSRKRKGADVRNMFGTSLEQSPNMFAIEQSRTEQSRADDVAAAGANPALQAIERAYCKAVGKNFASNSEHMDMRDLLIEYEHPEPIIQGIELAAKRRQERGDKGKINSPNYFKSAINEVLVGPKQTAASKPSALGPKPGKWKVTTQDGEASL